MKKKVWILNHYAGGMYFDKGWRHYWIAKFLKRNGYSPTIFCSNSKHNSNRELFFQMKGCWDIHMEDEISVPFIFVKARPYRDNGKERILNMLDFFKNVQTSCEEYAKESGKPDVIYASSVHPLTLVAGLKLAKKYNVKCICEVRDLWPESIFEYSPRMRKTGIFAKVLYFLEKNIYKKADAVIFTGEVEYNYIIEKGWGKELPREKFFSVNNGIDIDLFDKNRQEFQYVDRDLSNADIFKVVYTGSIRKVNGVGLLLDSAKHVMNSHIKFLIWGDGDQLEELKKRVIQEDINNVVFKGSVEKKYIPSIVSQADLNIAHNIPSPLFRFGISFNKLFEYLAAGRPVFSDFPCGYNPAVINGAGTDIDEVSPEIIAAEVEKYQRLNKNDYAAYCKNARNTAEKYDFKILTKEIIRILELV